MPLQKVKGGWKCPSTGKIYKTKAQAQKRKKTLNVGVGASKHTVKGKK